MSPFKLLTVASGVLTKTTCNLYNLTNRMYLSLLADHEAASHQGAARSFPSLVLHAAERRNTSHKFCYFSVKKVFEQNWKALSNDMQFKYFKVFNCVQTKHLKARSLNVQLWCREQQPTNSGFSTSYYLCQQRCSGLQNKKRRSQR